MADLADLADPADPDLDLDRVHQGWPGRPVGRANISGISNSPFFGIDNEK